ncbi:hypothetical protein GCM10023145_15930 [Angustibacter luteus]|uniref:Uncharacterized protein n=2 Tax=Angustibacter luteus TaxID=658456 RepID=A0ABW1JE96_9ACTN
MTMSTQVWAGGLGRRERLVRDRVWSVATVAARPGAVQVERTEDGLRVGVGDEPGWGGRRTWVVLRRDGSVSVDAPSTPPALLVSSTAARTLPAVPGVPERIGMDPGERLLVLSSDALDVLPESVVSVLQSLPDRVTGKDPVDLLAELFEGLPSGSGVIVTRRPAPVPVAGSDQEEATWGSAQRS